MKDKPLLIALDMDGSLCTTDKRITPYTAAVLERAAAAGALIVPATGRFYKGLPAELRDEPFLRYCITINGAHVYDAALDRTVSAAELPLARALDAMEYLDSQDVIYDCYQGDWGWITRRFWEIAPEYVPDRHYLKNASGASRARGRAQGPSAQNRQERAEDPHLHPYRCDPGRAAENAPGPFSRYGGDFLGQAQH